MVWRNASPVVSSLRSSTRHEPADCSTSPGFDPAMRDRNLPSPPQGGGEGLRSGRFKGSVAESPRREPTGRSFGSWEGGRDLIGDSPSPPAVVHGIAGNPICRHSLGVISSRRVTVGPVGSDPATPDRTQPNPTSTAALPNKSRFRLAHAQAARMGMIHISLRRRRQAGDAILGTSVDQQR